jgi:SAM-dependent methyltransferase
MTSSRRVRPDLLSLACCPVCHGELCALDDELRCMDCDRTFPVRGDVPELLVDEPPTQVGPSLVGHALGSLVAIPFVYDGVQRIAGAEPLFARLREALATAQNALVLDVGAGTGSLERLLPPSAQFLWLDSDPRKLAGFKRKSSAPAVLGDATRIPFKDGSVDWAVSVGVSHHLDDAAFGSMLDEIRRVTRERFLFLDAVVTPTLKSRLLWHYDRGRHARTAERLRRDLRARFEVVSDDEFTILHRYLLTVGR